MRNKILFRVDKDTEEEMRIAASYFPIMSSRMDCGDSLVIGRYSVLPFYQELERDLQRIDAGLINSFHQHQYVAQFDYYEDLKDYTFQTWFRLQDVPKDSGPWVVKGRTNSRKFQWAEFMYCETWADLVDRYRLLQNDPLIGPQGVIVRKYEKLELIQKAVAGPDFTNEWRFFLYKGHYLAHGYYWSQSDVYAEEEGSLHLFVAHIANILKEKVPFVVVDVAKTAEGEWRVVELNDGQMSGLSTVNPHLLYKNLAEKIKG